ncbi:ester cyclase [Pontivivens insulae]|uniref:SnoaL-like domain-containing protein n=1 Tax=Pontivivens insulae TaxID=1639689 RepID=A0A2R8AAJ5_9RHOB|nr:ester cyclase [Pontivivens insulae]RED13152.1 putative ester cyclase [Pontivivens insulae]SPF29244.1 hypothetical protein POI8812_01551 [Pontivivens insulae]
MSEFETARALLAPLRAAVYDYEADALQSVLDEIIAPDAPIRLAAPLPEGQGGGALATVFEGLAQALPDFERRVWIDVAGYDDHGHLWVGHGATIIGTFKRPWLDIPPTGHVVHMRCHDFFRVVDGQVVEMQSLWDIPEVMEQAGAWPLSPSMGREFHVQGPASSDGLGPHGPDGEKSRELIKDMLEHLKKHPSQGGPELMEMERFWHPKMTWYGPSGIGTARGIQGFRDWHQIPFLNAMPDRGLDRHKVTYHFFGEGDYAAVTGWPDMIQSITHPGWLGIAPNGKQVFMKSLDFWRVENGLIRENWVLVDLIDLYTQIGVDPLARMQEFNKARTGFDPETGRARPGFFD